MAPRQLTVPIDTGPPSRCVRSNAFERVLSDEGQAVVIGPAVSWVSEQWCAVRRTIEAVKIQVFAHPYDVWLRDASPTVEILQAPSPRRSCDVPPEYLCPHIFLPLLGSMACGVVAPGRALTARRPGDVPCGGHHLSCRSSPQRGDLCSSVSFHYRAHRG